MVNRKVIYSNRINKMVVMLVVLMLLTISSCTQKTRNDYELKPVCKLMESVIGKDLDESKSTVEEYFNVSLDLTKVEEKNDESVYFYVASETISISGVLITKIEIACLSNTDTVFKIGFSKENCSAAEADKYYQNYYDSLSVVYSFRGGVNTADSLNQQTTNLTGFYESDNNCVFDVGYSEESGLLSFEIECVSKTE